MAISKVIYKSSASAQGVTWIDATPATAAAADIISPKTAMLADGVVTQGTGSGGITPTGNINITQAGQTDVTNYATATVASGTEGTPTATKGTVSNHGITITPSVTNTTGYITGGTKTGTAVTVFASELVSGTLYCDDSGTWDVTNAANFVVDAGTEGTPTATKSAVSNHAVTVTPSVTNAEGWITGSTKTGTAVTVSASELVSGSETKTANGTYDVTNLASLVVNVAASGANIDTKTVTASNYPTSISFSSMKGTPKAFFLRSTSQISSSGNTTYYYVTDLVYDGNANNYCDGNCFRIGSTRRVDPITTAVSGGVVSGYTWSYNGTTLTITSSASSRSASPGAFNNSYKLVYIY